LGYGYTSIPCDQKKSESTKHQAPSTIDTILSYTNLIILLNAVVSIINEQSGSANLSTILATHFSSAEEGMTEPWKYF
jgi:hypothetical protein